MTMLLAERIKGEFCQLYRSRKGRKVRDCRGEPQRQRYHEH